jgi:hypothetical protein
MNRLITWLPATNTDPAREPELAEVLRELPDCVYIQSERAKRWIPIHWITEDEEA